VIILDNCNIHHSEKVRALVEDEACMYSISSHANITLIAFLDCKLIFLPPYSPDLNPIEQGFSVIKAYLKQHCDDFSLSIIDRACRSITPQSAWGFFRASGYVI